MIFISPAALAALPSPATDLAVQQSLKIDAKMSSPPTVGKNELSITVTTPDGTPVEHAKVTLTVGMTTMEMAGAQPKVVEKGKGIYKAAIQLEMSGGWAVTIKVEVPGFQTATNKLTFEAKSGNMKGMDMPGMDMKGDMSGMDMDSMKGTLGPWTMAREGSGTSWLPDSSPMFMLSLPRVGKYDLSVMGYFTYNYTSSGGPRGDTRFYSNSMPMLMARRETGGGVLGLDLMLSLDPIFNGEFGAPNLFQTGETAYGTPLVDHQHPHNLISEVAGSYSHPIGDGVNAFVYGGPVGEPSLGGPTFAHRPSGAEIPEAPISHHWFDSTHISYGVITAGINNNQWQLEGSFFNGHEPGENRYSPDPIALNSTSARLNYNPTKNLSLNVSHGFLDSPESTAPGVDQHRTTAAAIYSLPFSNGDNLSITGLTGRRSSEGTTSSAYLLEATYLTGPTSIFVRWENVDEDELIGVPAGTYNVNKILFGGVRNFTRQAGLDFGIGAYAGVYAFPSSLDAFYGRNPVTLGVFLRIRPKRM